MSSHLNPQPIYPPSGAKEGGFSNRLSAQGFCRLLAWLVKSHGELNFTFFLAELSKGAAL